MKRLVLLVFLVSALLTHADTSAPTVKGVIILTSAVGKDPVGIAFSDIAIGDFVSGIVTDVNVVKTTFDDRAIGKIVYFDENYYASLHRNV